VAGSTIQSNTITSFSFFNIGTATATTYTWNQTGSADWQVASNWTPTRTTPLATDILDFTNGATTTVTNVPTQTIGQLLVSNNTNVTLQAAGPAALTIAGITPFVNFDLRVVGGSSLNCNAANPIAINLNTGARGSISGAIAMSNDAHRLTAADASGITFFAGATFTEGAGSSGNPFGTTNLNSIVFDTSSTFNYIAGGDPFGAASPDSVVVFQHASTYSHQASTAPDFSGRTYSFVEINVPATVTVTGTNAVVMDNLTVTQGTLNFNMTGNPGHSIKGHITVAGTLNFNPASPGTVNLNDADGLTQVISGAGTLNLTSANQTLVINNPDGISLSRDVTLNNGTLTFTAGNVVTGSNTLIIGSAETVNHTSGHVIGNLRKTFAAASSKNFEVGTPNGYSPVNVVASAGTFPADFTVTAVQGQAPYVSDTNALQRYWALTDTTITNADLTFTYLPADVVGTVSSYQFIKNSGGFLSTLAPSGTPTSTSAAINGVSTFSSWTLAEPTAVLPGTLSFSGAPYSNSETNADHLVTVNVSRKGGADGAVPGIRPSTLPVSPPIFDPASSTST